MRNAQAAVVRITTERDKFNGELGEAMQALKQTQEQARRSQTAAIEAKENRAMVAVSKQLGD